VSLGFFLTLGPIYASEIAPLPLRPPLIAAVNFFITAGQFMAIDIGNGRFAIVTKDSYKLPFAIQWLFPGIILATAFLLPESPWYLVRHQKSEEAARSLARLHKSSFNFAGALAEIEFAIKKDRENSNYQQSASYLECFKGTDWRPTGIAFYAQGLYFLTIAGLGIELSFRLTLMGFGLGLVGNFLSWFLMNYFGR